MTQDTTSEVARLCCPYCGASPFDHEENGDFKCGTEYLNPNEKDGILFRSPICYSNENIKMKREVARLRELLHECLSFMALHSAIGAERSTAAEMRNRIIARLAPAPEEPVMQDSRITEPVTKRLCKDCGQPHSKHTLHPYETICPEPAPDWRELGADEVICEGDECRYIRELQYEQVMDSMLGGTPSRFKFYRFRTRRSLPVAVNPEQTNPVVVQKTEDMSDNDWRELGPDEVILTGDQYRTGDRFVHWMPVPDKWIGWEWSKGDAVVRTRRPLPTTNHQQISSKLVDGPKQEEMPLEDEIETLWEYSEHIDSLTGHMAFKALATCIRYLRDEIQKLKEAR